MRKQLLIFFVLGLFAGAGAIYFLTKNENSSSNTATIKVDQKAQNSPAQAPKTWYVALTGNDAAPGTKKELALKSIQVAIEKAGPGDVISIAPGVYMQSFRTVRSGTEDTPITILGTKDTVISGSQSHVIDINHSYITLKNFTVDGKINQGQSMSDYRDKLIYAIGIERKKGVEHVVIDAMTIKNAGGECVRFRYFARHNEIKNSTIQNCGRFDYQFGDGGKNGEGIYIGTAPEQLDDGKNPTDDRDVSENNWVHNNTISTNANECVDVKESSKNNLVERNLCSNQLDEESGGLDARGSYNTFRYNTVFDTKGAGIRLGGDSDDDGIYNNVYGNTLRNTAVGGIKILRKPQGKICDNSYENIKNRLTGTYAELYSATKKCD